MTSVLTNVYISAHFRVSDPEPEHPANSGQVPDPDMVKQNKTKLNKTCSFVLMSKGQARPGRERQVGGAVTRVTQGGYVTRLTEIPVVEKQTCYL